MGSLSSLVNWIDHNTRCIGCERPLSPLHRLLCDVCVRDDEVISLIGMTLGTFGAAACVVTLAHGVLARGDGF